MGIYIKTGDVAGVSGLGYGGYFSSFAGVGAAAKKAAAAALERAKVSTKVTAATTELNLLVQTLARLRTAPIPAVVWRRWIEAAFVAAAPALFGKAPDLSKSVRTFLEPRTRNAMKYWLQRAPKSFLGRVGVHHARQLGLYATPAMSRRMLEDMTRRFGGLDHALLLFTRVATYVASKERSEAAARAKANKKRLAEVVKLAHAAHAKRLAQAKLHAVALQRLAAAKAAAAKAPLATQRAAQAQVAQAAQVVKVSAAQVIKVNQVAQAAAQTIQATAQAAGVPPAAVAQVVKQVAASAGLLPPPPASVTASDVEKAADGGGGEEATNDAAPVEEASANEAPAEEAPSDGGGDGAAEGVGGDGAAEGVGGWASMSTAKKAGLGLFGALVLGVVGVWLTRRARVSRANADDDADDDAHPRSPRSLPIRTAVEAAEVADYALMIWHIRELRARYGEDASGTPGEAQRRALSTASALRVGDFLTTEQQACLDSLRKRVKRVKAADDALVRHQYALMAVAEAEAEVEADSALMDRHIRELRAGDPAILASAESMALSIASALRGRYPIDRTLTNAQQAYLTRLRARVSRETQRP